MTILRDKTILVVGAEEAARTAVAEEFRQAGSQVIEFTGGLETYDFARERPVDAALTAARLSSGDPYQLLSDLRRLHHDMPIVLFGAAEAEIKPADAFHRGFVAYFPQVSPVTQLSAAVAQGLTRAEERKQKKVERVSVAAYAAIVYGHPPRAVKEAVLNISRGGIFVAMERDFPEALSTVEFSLYFSGETHEPIEGKALVRWVREAPVSGHFAGVGLEFLEISPASQKIVDAYVERMGRRR